MSTIHSIDELSVSEVASRARELLALVEASPHFPRLQSSSEEYSSCWWTPAGYALVERWSEAADSGPLFKEAMRAMALKAAVYELTGSEALAELLLPPPVDEMTHAIIAQPNTWVQIMRETGFRFIHMTDLERPGYDTGCFTHRAYVEAWGQEPPTRYWLNGPTTRERLSAVNGTLTTVGIHDLGRRTELAFAGA